MRRFAKPIIVVSRCLGFDTCRYDGARVRCTFTQALRDRARVVTVCPEMGIGLGVPREKIILVRTEAGSTALYQPATGRKLTRSMRQYSRRWLDDLGEVDGFLLKSKSPSCGLGTCKLFGSGDPESRPIGRESGLFAAEVKRRYRDLPLIDERTLDGHRQRERWLTAVYALAEFRRVARYRTIASLRRFHEYYCTLFEALSKPATTGMERLLDEHLRIDRLLVEYRSHVERILLRPVKPQALVRSFETAVAFYRTYLTRQNFERYNRTADSYLAGGTTAAALRSLIQVWGVRYDKSFIRDHALYRPYPAELGRMDDSRASEGLDGVAV